MAMGRAYAELYLQSDTGGCWHCLVAFGVWAAAHVCGMYANARVAPFIRLLEWMALAGLLAHMHAHMHIYVARPACHRCTVSTVDASLSTALDPMQRSRTCTATSSRISSC